MTVQELIAELSKYPPQARVVMAASQSGFEDASAVLTCRIVLDDNVDPADPAKKANWYNGRHTNADVDLPLSIHPVAVRVSEFCTPSGAGGATAIGGAGRGCAAGRPLR